MPRYSPVGSKLLVKPNEASQPTVYVPPFAGVPLLNVPVPTTELPELEELVVVVVELELDFFEPHPAASAASATTAAAMSASRRNFVMRDFSFLGGSAIRSPFRPHIEGVTETVTEEVEGERCDDQEGAWEEHEPPGDVVQL